MKVTVANVVAINTAVATIDLGESRAIPQTPWPDVQPEAKVIPTPTITPPKIRV